MEEEEQRGDESVKKQWMKRWRKGRREWKGEEWKKYCMRGWKDRRVEEGKGRMEEMEGAERVRGGRVEEGKVRRRVRN